ncbi:hypothetical protein D9M68_663030 [compost metagenome]
MPIIMALCFPEGTGLFFKDTLHENKPVPFAFQAPRGVGAEAYAPNPRSWICLFEPAPETGSTIHP